MAEDEHVRVLRDAATKGRVLWHQHALERLLARGITRAEVLSTIGRGEVIERYPGDRPFPSLLIHLVGDLPLHVVAAADVETGTCHVITVYRPDLDHFEPDLKTRRKKP